MSKAYFDDVATQWETMRQDFFSEAVREAALERAFILAPCADGQGLAKALDMGAGSGFVSRGLTSRGLGVVAVDQSRSMLDTLQRELPQADCRLAEGDALPLDSGSVDYAFANMFLHHAPDPALAIREMVRVLRPGGALVITDLDQHAHEFLRREHHDRWMGFDRPQVLAWLQEAGLEESRVDCAGQQCCAASNDGSDSASVSIFMASGRKPFQPSLSAQQVGKEATAIFATNMYCAESVVLALARAHAIRSELLPSLATGFCSGFARTDGPCGALMGGVMALGMIKGRSRPDDDFLPCYEVVQELRAWFEERFGSTACSVVTGCDLSTAEGRKAFDDKGLCSAVCAGVVRETAAMVQELLLVTSPARA